MAFNDIAPIGVTFEVDTSGLRKAEQAVSGAGSNISKKMGGIGKAAGIALAAGIATAGIAAARGVANYFGSAIKSSSDLAESVNAVKVSFGEASGEIIKLGETAADRLGLSERAFNGLAVQFTSFAETIAGPGGNVVNTLDDLTTRGADFASVMNLEVEDALTKFQSGLAGQTEPLRQFGIDLSAAKVEAYAYENGIAKVGSTLTEEQKIQARYGSLMQQTTKFAGDFANTSDGLANSQRRLQARLENLSGEVGDELLPIQLELTKAFLEMLPALKTAVIPAIKDLSKAFTKDILPAILSILPQLVNMISFIGRNSDVILALTPAVLGLVGAVKALNIVNALSAGIFKTHPILALASILIPLIAYLIDLGIKTGFFTEMFKRLGDQMNLIGAVITKIVNESGKAIGNFFSGIFEFLGGIGESLYNFGKEAWQRFVQGALDALLFLPGLAADIIEKVPLVGEGIANGIRTATGGVRGAVSAVTGTQNTAAGKPAAQGTQQVNYFNVSAQGLTVDAVNREAQKIGNLRAPILGGA